MKPIYIVIVASLIAYILLGDDELDSPATILANSQSGSSQVTPRQETFAPIASPDEFGRADVGKQIRGSGTVVRVLSDDNDGSRHQRFILRLASGQTLLVAHNIDLAPRIGGISVDDSVEFYGEYEWNSQGGVVHWTHYDPNGRHVDGWLRSKGRTYQ